MIRFLTRPGHVPASALPDFFGKCQIIERTQWTEEEYETKNSLHFLEEFSMYLEAKARAEAVLAKRKK